jgi:hypothetical protein
LCEYNTRIKKNVFRHQDSNLQTLSSHQCQSPTNADWSVRKHGQTTEVLHSEDSEKSLTSIHVFIKIRQTYWCLFSTHIWNKSL